MARPGVGEARHEIGFCLSSELGACRESGANQCGLRLLVQIQVSSESESRVAGFSSLPQMGSFAPTSTNTATSGTWIAQCRVGSM